jgi:hypothetical protein
MAGTNAQEMAQTLIGRLRSASQCFGRQKCGVAHVTLAAGPDVFDVSVDTNK